MDKLMNTYSLYQTLNHNIPKKDLNVSEKKKICTTNFTHEEKVAFFRLILEHFRLDGGDLTTDHLPYEIKQTEEGVSMDLANIPKSLRWILLKFTNLCIDSNKE